MELRRVLHRQLSRLLNNRETDDRQPADLNYRIECMEMMPIVFDDENSHKSSCGWKRYGQLSPITFRDLP